MACDVFVASMGITSVDTEALILNTDELALLRHISRQLAQHTNASWKQCPLALTIVFNEVARNTVSPYEVKPKSFFAIESTVKRWGEAFHYSNNDSPEHQDWGVLKFLQPTNARVIGRWNDTEMYITSQIHSLLHTTGAC